MSNTVRAWANDATSRGPSTRLWGRKAQPLTGEIWQNPSMGWGLFDDFTEFQASGNKYTLVEADATADIDLLATEVGGVLRMQVDTTDNMEAYIATLADAGQFKIDGGTGQLWFEARVRVSSVANDTNGFAIGLGEEGFAATDALTNDASVIADKDFVGFNVVQADGDALTLVHNTASGGGVTTVDAALDFGGIAVDTWYKLGFHFDGLSGGTITWYVNGTPESATTTEDAANFPDGEELGFFAGVKLGSANTNNLDIDWWAAAQEAV